MSSPAEQAAAVEAVEAVLRGGIVDRKALSLRHQLDAAAVDRIVDAAIAEHLRPKAAAQRSRQLSARDGFAPGQQGDLVLPRSWLTHPDRTVRQWAEGAKRCIEAAAAEVAAAPLKAERNALLARLAAIDDRLDEVERPARGVAPCEVCGRVFDARGMGGHMARHAKG